MSLRWSMSLQCMWCIRTFTASFRNPHSPKLRVYAFPFSAPPTGTMDRRFCRATWLIKEYSGFRSVRGWVLATGRNNSFGNFHFTKTLAFFALGLLPYELYNTYNTIHDSTKHPWLSVTSLCVSLWRRVYVVYAPQCNTTYNDFQCTTYLVDPRGPFGFMESTGPNGAQSDIRNEGPKAKTRT